MITRKNIIERLTQKYPQYSFISTEVTKNGDVHLKGICVRDNSPIAPTIYTDDIIFSRFDIFHHFVEGDTPFNGLTGLACIFIFSGDFIIIKIRRKLSFWISVHPKNSHLSA